MYAFKNQCVYPLPGLQDPMTSGMQIALIDVNWSDEVLEVETPLFLEASFILHLPFPSFQSS